MRKTGLYIAFFMFGTFLLIACGSSMDNSWEEAKKVHRDQFHTFLQHHQKRIVDFDSILIIPRVGCEGCITNAKAFYHRHKEVPTILYVFTDIQDPKIFRQEVPDSLWSRPNIVVDIDDQWTKTGFQSTYPSLFHIQNKQLFYKTF